VADTRRQRLYDIDQTLANPDITSESVTQLAEELFAIIEIESLWPQLCVYYEELAKAYMSAGDMENARKYVEKTENTWIEFGGVEHENVEGVQQLWRDFRWVLEQVEED
jgi:hypothetical protein